MGGLVTDLFFSSPTTLIYLYVTFLYFMCDGQLLLQKLSCLVAIPFSYYYRKLQKIYSKPYSFRAY